MHALPLILLITLMALISGCQSYRGMADFIQKNRKELLSVLKLKKKRLPSRDTLIRAVERTDFDELAHMFTEWSLQRNPLQQQECIALDGKAIRGTVSGAQNNLQRFTNLVSAYSSTQKQVLACKKIENDKESEIPSVRALIELLGLKGVVFTADALHCQKETTRIITEGGNDYILGLKGNQKKLLQQVKKTNKKGRP